MTEQITTKEIQKIAEVMQSFRGNQPLLLSFLPPLTALIDFLNHSTERLINENVGLNPNEITQFETVAQMFHVLGYDCIHNNPTPETIALAKVCSQMENICLTTAQHCKGVIDNHAGHFYASEQNMAEVTQASLDALEATNTKAPIHFVQIS